MPPLSVQCIVKRSPVCWPPSVQAPEVSGSRVFVGDRVEFVATASRAHDNQFHHWIFPNGKNFTLLSSNGTSKKIHTFEDEGVHAINVSVALENWRAAVTFVVIALREVYFNYDIKDCLVGEAGRSSMFSMSATILSNRSWTIEMVCNHGATFRTTFNTSTSACAPVRQQLPIRFDQTGEHRCTLKASDGRKILHLGAIACQVFTKLGSVVIRTKNAVASGTPVEISAEVSPDFETCNGKIAWKIYKQHADIYYTVDTFTFLYTFKIPGRYNVHVDVFNPLSRVTHEVSIDVQDIIGGLSIESPKAVEHRRTHSTVLFKAKFTSGSRVFCRWMLHCQHFALLKPQNYNLAEETCNFRRKFRSPTSCSITVTVFNKVSQLELLDKFKILIEEPIPEIEVVTPSEVKFGNYVTVTIYIPKLRQPVYIDINGGFVTRKVLYRPHQLVCSAAFLPEQPKPFLVRVRTYNNVSSVVVRKIILVIPELRKVDMVNVGCTAVGFPLRFVAYVDGTVPKEGYSLLFHWLIRTPRHSQSFYTSVPTAHSEEILSPGDYSVTVTVSNKVSSISGSLIGQVSASLLSPCLHHEPSIPVGSVIHFYVLGLPTPLPLSKATLQIRLDDDPKPLHLHRWQWISNSTGGNDALRWRYISQSSGFHRIMCLLFLEASDIVSNLSFASGFQVVYRLTSVRITSPLTVYISRLPVTWHADVHPHTHGCIFFWNLDNKQYVTAAPQLTFQLSSPLGTYVLELKVWNALGSIESSMVLEVVSALLLLNYATTNFFSNHSGCFNFEINQLVPPSGVFVDFGDNSVYDSKVDNSSSLLFVSKTNSSSLSLCHTYKYIGIYDVFFNISNFVSSIEHWTTVIVEEKISGVELILLTPPVVALLEDVTVMCLVDKGTNLEFEWDFGDGSGGQYTREDAPLVDSFKTKRTAHHSYGIASLYNVSVHIFNNYESIVVHLNTSIQAVECIEQLHLQPRIRGQYSAPLYKNKVEEADRPFSTAPIEFEAWVWRGSDVQFLFHFGDGNSKSVSSLLNAWSLRYAAVKHIYSAEGQYEVFVTATNLLSSVNESLEQPFYVQFPPENLMLEKKYYIIEHHSNLTLQATITQGTNVSYSWKVGDQYIEETGSTLFLPFLEPGIYVVSVEAFNHVTDYGYRRPSATAKIYVQEKLLGVQVCIHFDGREMCDAGVLDLPLDEEVHYLAKVIPPTETALRFLWQLDADEIRRTSVPFLKFKYQQAGWYSINVTAQNHISSVSSLPIRLNLVQKVANLTSILCQGPNLVNQPITFRALYWFGTNLTFEWDFGDGSNPVLTTSSSAQHTYNEVGEYWVTVNAWNQFSHANITSNMFFLHHMCRKPEISFLHQWNRIASSNEDILLEAAISIMCKSANVEYNWSVQGSNKNVTHMETLNQRQLVIPGGFLDPGTYSVNLKVNMVGTIVYADLLTTLVVEQSRPVVFIEGGFVRSIGVDDSRELIANVIFADNATHPVNYVWSCIPLIQKHHPCFNDPHLLHLHNSSRLTIPTSLIGHNLGAIVVNVTIDSGGPISASQVLEIKQIPHMLQVDIQCEECHDHRVNHLDQIQMRVVCRSCGALLEYQWKIWIIEDEYSRIHFSNHECVQADGSTFFIVAPNLTETAVNSTHLLSKNIQPKFLNFSEDPMLSEKPHDTVEDLPPFPNLPGFPEENTTLEGPKLLRSLRNADILDITNRIPYSDSLHEGEVFYEDNSTSEDSPYSDFISFFDDGLLLGSPDYVITEEGVPGEGGSAAARNQSLPNLAISGDQILEEVGKPRMKTSGNTNVLVDNPRLFEEDALRDKFSRKSPVPHIVSRSRSMLYSLEHYTTTGFDKEYLVIKPGVLKSGRSYLVHAKVVNKENNKQEGFAMEYFKVNMGPVNGRCTLMPVEGFSLHFDFRLHCLEWRSNHFPLYYELHYSREKDSAGHLIYFGLNSNVKFNLPAGLASDSYHVYLNVIVRDNLGAQTKVCSLARKVMPAHMNVSMENYVYNETFHPRASLKRLLGEKHNQAVLQKIHVLASSLNSNNSFLEAPNIYAIRSKIRQEFFEIVCSLKISNKVEATQIISVLYEIIADVTISAAELQKCYNIYKRIDDLQPKLFKFFASQQMHTELVVFLAKLAFVSNYIYPRNNDLIEIARLNLMIKIKNFLKTRLSIESPLRIDVPHLSAAAFYITKAALILEPFILLKSTAIQYLDNSIFISKYFKSRRTRDQISSEKCLSFMAHEYDYINLPHKQNMHSSAKSSVLLCFDSCKDEDFEIGSLNVSINFIKTSENKNNRSVVLKENCMNVHAINITEEEAGHSLLFYVKLEAGNNTEIGIAVDVMFRSQNHPTLKEFDMKMSLPSGTSEINLFLSPDKLKVPGVYYVSMLPRDFSNKKTTEKVWLYKVFIWKDVCLGKVGDFWSSKNCHVLETSNNSWTHCKCSAEEVASYSVPLEWELILVPVSQLIDPYFNSAPLIAFILLLLLYCILLYINFRKDQSVYLSHSPVPLRDNNGKHKQFYLIILKTGFYFNSGTTASVFIVLHGTKDVTETRQLIGSNAKKFSFQKGSVDMFLMSTAHNLGPLLKLEVWHNNQGPSPSWYLKSISVKDLNKDLFYHFDCHNWLSAEKGDFLIERELTVAESSPKLKELFFDDLLTCMNDFNMWNAVVSQSPASFFTGIQRITCCLCFLLNCAFLLTLYQEEYIELSNGKSVLGITRWTYITSCLTALASTLPQVFFTILFRFSSCPSINVDPKLRDFFCSLSLFSLNCWLKSKRSTSSHSTHRSSSSSLDNRSDSLYSSFEDSSIMSVPDLLEESSLSEREKHLTSCPDMRLILYYKKMGINRQNIKLI